MPEGLYHSFALAEQDRALRRNPIGATGGNLWGNGLGNPDPFRRGVNAETAFNTRKQAKRIYAPAAGALAAQNALFAPTLALARRGAEGYGQLYRDEAGKSLDWANDQMEGEYDPETAALIKLLMGDASGLVGRGNNPYEDRETVQSIRGAQASRGMGYGQSDALQEILGLDRERDSRRIQRGQYGAGIAQLGQNYYQSSLAQLLGIGPQGSEIMSPIHPTGTEDFLSINMNDIQQRRNDKAARRAGQQALWGSAIEAVGSIAGGFASKCWVADELYGKDDPRTHLARAYANRQPEEGFFAEYAKHGKEWAAWLKANPAMKPLVQWKWDEMWREQQRWLALNSGNRRGMSKGSIAVVREEMAAHGKLEPLRERVDKLLDKCIEPGFNGVRPAPQLPA